MYPKVSATFTNSLESALEMASELTTVNEIYVIGGGQIYEQALLIPQCRTFHLTYVSEKVNFGFPIFLMKIEPWTQRLHFGSF
jgi:dihydrofolate reductase